MSVVVHQPIMPGPQREPTSSAFGYQLENTGAFPGPGVSQSTLFDISNPPPPTGNPILSSDEENHLNNSLAYVVLNNPGEGLADLGDFPFDNGPWYPGHAPPMQFPAPDMAPLPIPQDPANSFDLMSPTPFQSGSQDFANNQNLYYTAPAGSAPATSSINPPTTPIFAPHNSMPHDPSPSPMQQLSPDGCQAAQVLQSGTLRRHPSQSVHLRHVDEHRLAEDFRRASRSQDRPGNPIFGFRSTVVDNYHDVPRQQRDPPRALTFGTDETFNNATYQPKNKNETLEFMAGRQDVCVKGAVEISHSAGSTQPSTPVCGPPLELRTNVRPTLRTADVCHAEPKRRHSSNEEPQSATQRNTSRKRKANRASTGSPSVDGNYTKKKRRPSGATAKKDNLTSEQKRENHIASEKKRRRVIEIGFKNLNALVPALRDQPVSKAGTLHAAHEFYVQAMQGNAELRDILSQLRDR